MTDVESREITDPKVKWFGSIALGIAVVISALYILDYQLGWIDCWAFEWSDFATLVTGAIAACGAVWIGMRQSKISDRQTEILNHQVEIERITLRAELYDRRLQIYTEVMTYAANIWSDEHRKNVNNVRSYIMAMEGSKFLFNANVHVLLSDIMKNIVAFNSLSARLDMPYEARHDEMTKARHDLADDIIAKTKRFEEMATLYMRIDEHAGNRLL